MARRPRLIVDGYNIIGRGPRYDVSDMDGARTCLVEDVAAYAAVEGLEAVIVFDGGGNPLSEGRPHRVAGLTVVFSPYGQDADTVIERMAADLRSRGEEGVVVTSDSLTQSTVMGAGITRMSADGLLAELGSGGGDWRDDVPSGSLRGRLEDRIDARVRDALRRWARGG